MKALLELIRANKAGQNCGIYSVCSAHPQVLMAALAQAKQDGRPLLIEATANQVNQYGGYTGMQPPDFIKLFAVTELLKLASPVDEIVNLSSFAVLS